MTKKLTRHGNSLALVIDKPILELLNIDEDTGLNVSTDGRSLVVSPVLSAKEDARFRAALKRVHKKYGRTLKALAE
jgi:antitoxin component of MazEF toxin-antitoxin module